MYALSAIEIGSTLIDQITSQSIDPALAHHLSRGSSLIDPDMIANINDAQASVQFRTTALRDALGITGLSAGIIKTGEAGIAVLWFRKYEDYAEFDDAAKHTKVTINLGIMHVVSVEARADANEPAEGTFVITPIFDGTNQPLIFEKDVAFGVTHAVPDQFGLGKGWVNSVLLNNPQYFRYTSGIQLRKVKGAGTPHLLMAGIRRREQLLEWGSPDIALMDSDQGSPDFGIQGKAITGVNRGHLQKLVPGASFEAEGTAGAHIRFDVSTGVAYAQSFTSAPGTDVQYPLTIRPHTVSLSTAAVISGT